MAAVVTPRVRIMVVCDGVRESKTESGVFDLKGVRQSVRAAGFPFTPHRLWLYLLLSSPRPGLYPGYIRVINAGTQKAVFYNHLSPGPRFEQDEEFVALRSGLTCTFPEPGRYVVEVSFFQQHGSDVVKGEMPLLIVQSGA